MTTTGCQPRPALKLRMLSHFPATGYLVAITGGLAGLLAVFAESMGLSKDIGEPIIHGALVVVLAVGVVVYLIGIGGAAAIDPSGFFSFRLKPWIRASPRWMQALWIVAVFAVLGAFVAYRSAPGPGWAIAIAITGLSSLAYGMYMSRRGS
jgi:hypothetical protein